MSKATKQYFGWAIFANSDEGHDYIGRYWWFGGKGPYPMPASLEGHVLALFCTRKIARENLGLGARGVSESKSCAHEDHGRTHMTQESEAHNDR